MREDDSIETIAKELIKAAQASRFVGYAVFSLAVIYITAVFATWTVEWLVRRWDAALVLAACVLVFVAWHYYKWDGK